MLPNSRCVRVIFIREHSLFDNKQVHTYVNSFNINVTYLRNIK